MDNKIINNVCNKIMHSKITKEMNVDEWEWPLGVGLYGLYLNYKKTGDKKLFNWLIDWFEEHIEAGLPERNINTTAPMFVLAHIAEETNNKRYMEMCVDWVKWIMEKLPRTENGVFQHICTGVENRNQVWDDTLFMTVLFVAKMAQILDDCKLKEEVEYQFMMHARCLYDTKTGLWFHGWSFEGNHNFGEALWGRGNCWITASIPLCLEMLPNMSSSVKRYLINVLKCQIDALVKYQNKCGLWHTVLDDDDSYLETSASAGFAYGMMKSINMNLIGEEYRTFVTKAIDSIKKEIGEDGIVNNVSGGTPMGDTKEFYKTIACSPKVYGQGLTILALIECE